jgi:fatty acid/phospholipid biosynthesis enzyme
MVLSVEIDYFTKQNQQACSSNGNTASAVSVSTWNLSIIEIVVRFGTMGAGRKPDSSRVCTNLKLDNC